jgi:hypothetical protein
MVRPTLGPKLRDSARATAPQVRAIPQMVAQL